MVPSPHRVPGEGCFCGFYAMKELDAQLLDAVTMARAAHRSGMEEVFVLGRVELAGKVIEHELGYRAERARIVELIPLRGQEQTVEAIARRAGVSVGRPVRVRRTSIRDGARRLRFAWAVSKAMPPSPIRRRSGRTVVFFSTSSGELGWRSGSGASRTTRAAYRDGERRRPRMNIGEQRRTIYIEPIEEPAPMEEPAPPVEPDREPEHEPA